MGTNGTHINDILVIVFLWHVVSQEVFIYNSAKFSIAKFDAKLTIIIGNRSCVSG